VAANSVWVPAQSQLLWVDPRRLRVVKTIQFPDSDAQWVEGSFHRIWAIGSKSFALTEIDPETGRVVRRIQLGTLLGPAASTRHYLWIIDPINNRLLRFKPTTAAITATVPLPAGRAVSITANATHVWVGTETSNTLHTPRCFGPRPCEFAGNLYRVDERSLAIKPVTTPGLPSAPTAISLHSGRVWVLKTDGTLTSVSTKS
jgi:sugar lactone lactonase YvrE